MQRRELEGFDEYFIANGCESNCKRYDLYRNGAL